MRTRWQIILLSLLMAGLTWHLVTGREMVEAWVPVSVQITNPPKGLIVRDGMVSSIQVRVRGPKGLIRALDDQKLVYSIDADTFRIGENVIIFDGKKLQISNAYTVEEIKPQRLLLVVDRIETRKAAVEVTYGGDVPPGMELKSLAVQPDTVQLEGPASVLKDIDVIKLELEEVPQEGDLTTKTVMALPVPEEVRVTPAEVTVMALFGLKTREIWIKVPLEIKAPEDYTVKPVQDYVRLLIEGPVTLFLDNEFRKDVHTTLIIQDGLAAGEYEDLIYAVELPENCSLIRRNPETIRATIRRK